MGRRVLLFLQEQPSKCEDVNAAPTKRGRVMASDTPVRVNGLSPATASTNQRRLGNSLLIPSKRLRYELKVVAFGISEKRISPFEQSDSLQDWFIFILSHFCSLVSF